MPTPTIYLLGALRADTYQPLPFHVDAVQAGFPSPAEGWVEKSLDLNELCIKHPDASYFVRVAGDSMIDAGITDGDILLIDRAIPAVHGAVVVARIGPELTVKRYETKPVRSLVPANPAFSPIIIADEEVELIGVVTFVIKRLWP